MKSNDRQLKKLRGHMSEHLGQGISAKDRNKKVIGGSSSNNNNNNNNNSGNVNEQDRLGVLGSNRQKRSPNMCGNSIQMIRILCLD